MTRFIVSRCEFKFKLCKHHAADWTQTTDSATNLNSIVNAVKVQPHDTPLCGIFSKTIVPLDAVTQLRWQTPTMACHRMWIPRIIHDPTHHLSITTTIRGHAPTKIRWSPFAIACFMRCFSKSLWRIRKRYRGKWSTIARRLPNSDEQFCFLFPVRFVESLNSSFCWRRSLHFSFWSTFT